MGGRGEYFLLTGARPHTHPDVGGALQKVFGNLAEIRPKFPPQKMGRAVLPLCGSIILIRYYCYYYLLLLLLLLIIIIIIIIINILFMRLLSV